MIDSPPCLQEYHIGTTINEYFYPSNDTSLDSSVSPCKNFNMHSFSVEKKSQEDNMKKMEMGQKWVFLATFINYAMAHWTRKSYTNVKVQLMLAGVSPLTLTAMDSGFMFTYAGGSFITGQLGDRFSPVNVVGAGLLGSTVCLGLIILGASTSIITNAGICGTFFLTCQMLHGAFQATGGPVSTSS